MVHDEIRHISVGARGLVEQLKAEGLGDGCAVVLIDELVHGGELAATGARLCALGVLEAEDSDCGDGVPGLEGEG